MNTMMNLIVLHHANNAIYHVMVAEEKAQIIANHVTLCITLKRIALV